MKQDKYMGMDVHQATTVVAVRDGKGKLVSETILETEAGCFARLLEGWKSRCRRDTQSRACFSSRWGGLTKTGKGFVTK